MGFLQRLVRRLWGELFTPSGRRRLCRRVASRFLLVGLALAWTYPFVAGFWETQVVDFVTGRVLVTGHQGPVLRTSVVLVPDLPEPADPAALARYALIDRGGSLPGVHTPQDAALHIWTDVDGRFSQMHVAPGLPYRVEVRRPGCPVHVHGVYTFRLLDFWSRRLALQVPPCALSC